MHQNLVLPTREEALRAPRGDLDLYVCQVCGFVFNAAFDGSKLAYGADYDNTQSHSPYFARYMADLAGHLVRDAGVRDCRIVEVGCGKGVFLRMLVADSVSGNSGIGFDPSYAGPLVDLDGRLRFERRFYDEACADVPADVVVCRHVIEHVPQPLELLRAVKRALRNAVAPRIFFETPCVEWILRNQVIWDFFYEHCSLFTASSLRAAFEQTGFAVHDVKHVFGGQYLWLEASLGEEPEALAMEAGEISHLARQFADEDRQLRDEWLARISGLMSQGKVAIWGAGAKGTTFAHMIDPDGAGIDCLVDLNPNKQGKFVPGSGHPIVGIEGLKSRGVTSAILMNPNYRDENMRLLAAAGIALQLVE
ncbi:class I SAM-dependent methyltransferase [Noviherbaspirillum sp. ST 5-3]|uniref:class I SAM-dependent methyltransferase n=1 Tax=Noviherbaspirillum sp. ST 5-3 TaxID=3349878 RepID=UPI003916FFD4